MSAARRLGSRFWTLFSSTTVSNLGDGVGRVALPLLAATLTRDPILVGSLVSFSFVPWLLFALISGALVDRIDRRKAMIGANLVRAVIVGGLGLIVLAGGAQIWMLYIAAFLLGAAETLYDSAARAMLPSVIDRDQLERGNGRMEASEVVSQEFLGAPLGSLLFVLVAAGPFLANSAGFLVAALLLFALPGSYRAVPKAAESTAESGSAAEPSAERTPASRSLRAEIAEGLRWLWAHRLLRPLMLLTGLVTVALEASMALVVLLVVDELNLSEAIFGLFALAMGLGGLLAGLVAGVVTSRLPRAVVLVASVALAGLSVLAIGVLPGPILAAAMLTLSALFIVLFNVITMSLRQAVIPASLFGRIQGAYRTVIWGLMPLGGLLGGLIASVAGLRAVYLVSGIALLGTSVAFWLLVRRPDVDLSNLHNPDDAEPDESMPAAAPTHTEDATEPRA
ncbi:MFS transporter [Actinoalloteichus hymeniacidonis]|uniref:Arabinose efflux permease family protein n=1 Tax=Actinoalloteichus hymeniacidonis TaxID=340345 RepID=A0AAC9N132_9PSEU|nr:MFS transporter [Actinoalloteichus hymeniacidonis]AOS65702.1 arabinose efflux permease family protein [Actinoalloteichus hymeniacidonis]MBB5906208.1 MFS family permease [Actinoalloteichus hymeniacidonis]